MSQTVDILLDKRAKLVDEASAIFAALEQDARTLTAEERKRLDDIDRELNELDELVARKQKLQERIEALGKSQGRIATPQVEHETRYTPNHYPEQFTGKPVESILVRRYRAGDYALVDRVVGLFRALVQGSRAEARALAEGTGSAGGFLVPEEFAADVIAKLGQLTPLANREFLRVFPMARDVMRVPKLTTRPTVARWPENTPAPAITEPAFGEVQLTAQPFGALVPISNDLLADTSIELLEFLRDLFAEILAEKRNDLLLNGTGTNEPEGVRSASGVATHAAVLTDGGTKYDSLVDTFQKVKAAYRQGGIWITSQKGLGVLMKIKDANGLPILQQAQNEPFRRLFGAPLFETEAVPSNLGAGSDETEIIFGNWKFYAFGDRQQMEVDTDRSGKYFEARQTAIAVLERYDGRVAQPEAFVRGTGWK